MVLYIYLLLRVYSVKNGAYAVSKYEKYLLQRNSIAQHNSDTFQCLERYHWKSKPMYISFW